VAGSGLRPRCPRASPGPSAKRGYAVATLGELGGFLRISRSSTPQRDPRERLGDYEEIYRTLTEERAGQEGARCMECGVPFCHDGCPLGNLIPDWNDLVYQQRWREAIDQLHATNDFPEFTGRICPAPCEPACVLAINDDPVAIKNIELAIVERAWSEGWIVPTPPTHRTGRRVAVVGSGPAGLAAANQLNRAGHDVTVFERDEGPGGLLRFGVPDPKLEKWVIDRRVGVLEAEGVAFRYGVDVGPGHPTEELLEEYDAVVLAIGSRVHRALDIPGTDLAGVRVAMDYLYARNRWVARKEDPGDDPELTAAGKHVVIIGGGDTAMDCVANATRERAASVTVLDTYPAPPSPVARDSVPWPQAPRRLVSTYSLDEGGERRWTQTASELEGRDGHVVAVRGSYVTPPPNPQHVAGTEFTLPADLVLVAIGFSHPEHEGPVRDLRLELDRRGNVKAGAYLTSHPGVFAAGDARMGQSLIVNAIAEGRRCARVVDRHLAALPVA
jgi:glutamate synthase (NADPH) small chain